jgi:hypothetical protein
MEKTPVVLAGIGEDKRVDRVHAVSHQPFKYFGWLADEKVDVACSDKDRSGSRCVGVNAGLMRV